ncbi:iron-sulfur cluster assembly scaffold protein [Patescibacteria group bacterium]|nr:iron-sulfur cluster assembly scaffold protein [Patescibacteria group bacterium]
MSNIYHEDLLDEAKNPSNYGEMDNPDLVSTQYNASCGDVITVSVKLSDDKKTIEDIKWKGQGCVISQASMSVLSEKIKGLEIIKLQKLTQKEILEELGLSEISVGRVKCLLLGLGAVKKLV